MKDSDSKPVRTTRSTEFRPSVGGRLTARWQMTDYRITDPVQIAIPPQAVLPIVFVPGIMGSNISDREGTPRWVLNSFAGAPAGLAMEWARRGAGARQKVLHPNRTKVFDGGSVPSDSALGLTEDELRRRGWGEVSEASYHEFLSWLDYKLNRERNPARWNDFEPSSASELIEHELEGKLPPGLVMHMPGLPTIGDGANKVDPITSDELLKRSKFRFPVYACGYNWLDTNVLAAQRLRERIESIIAENNGGHSWCTQVILVTHSMGGLVARACAQLREMNSQILGIVHGVMPATGAAVAYRRCKVGMKDENYAASLVIGSDGQQVTAVFAQSPGALQLLPSEEYGGHWLSVNDPSGKELMTLPKTDPYDEIYLQKEKWWGLVRDDWLRPANGKGISWNSFVKNIRTAREFHRHLAGSYHARTFVFYGGGKEKRSFHKIRWQLTRWPTAYETKPAALAVPELTHKDVRTEGLNSLHIEGTNHVTTFDVHRETGGFDMPTRVWEIHCAMQDSEGDGTVPRASGRFPAATGAVGVIQQFEIADIEHEPAYKKYPAAKVVTHYAITKLAALAKIQ